MKAFATFLKTIPDLCQALPGSASLCEALPGPARLCKALRGSARLRRALPGSDTPGLFSEMLKRISRLHLLGRPPPRTRFPFPRSDRFWYHFGDLLESRFDWEDPKTIDLESSQGVDLGTGNGLHF